MKAGVRPIAAERWVPFVETWAFLGVDFTGATFAMQIRLYPDADGDPLVDLTTVETGAAEGVRLIYAGTATVTAHIAAGRLSAVPDGLTGGDSVALSRVGIRVNEATMEGLPFAAERGDDSVLAYDLVVNPSGGLKQVWAKGPFTVLAGVTQ